MTSHSLSYSDNIEDFNSDDSMCSHTKMKVHFNSVLKGLHHLGLNRSSN